MHIVCIQYALGYWALYCTLIFLWILISIVFTGVLVKCMMSGLRMKRRFEGLLAYWRDQLLNIQMLEKWAVHTLCESSLWAFYLKAGMFTTLFIITFFLYIFLHWQLTCGICFDTYPCDRIQAVACGHPFCNSCWAGLFYYIITLHNFHENYHLHYNYVEKCGMSVASSHQFE